MRLFTWTVAAAALAACESGTERKGDELGTGPLAFDLGPSGLSLVDVVPPGSFTSPVALVSDPDGRLLVVDQIGLVRVIHGTGVQETPLLDLRTKLVPLVAAYDERGLLGLALHPRYAQNGKLYVWYSAPLRAGAPEAWDHTNVLSEFTVSPSVSELEDTLATERVLLEVDHPSMNHNGGTLAFGPDGLLYLSLGDGGNRNDQGLGHPRTGNGQSRDTLLGKVLRLDVDHPGLAPPSNPFAGGGGHPLVYAYGFRNPYRFSFDRQTGRLWLADVGQDLMEEIDVVEPGGNYGWNVREGFLCFDEEDASTPLPDCASVGSSGEPLIDPIAAFVHTPRFGPRGIVDDPASIPGLEGWPQLGLAAVGGFVYRGSALGAEVGHYFLGSTTTDPEVASGKLLVAEERGAEWTVSTVALESSPAPTLAFLPPADPDAPAWTTGALPFFVLGLGEDSDGELYVLANETLGPRLQTGRVFQLVATEP